ncbi:hypothetical protein CBR_g41664 [Chara braunii]|uniref:Uncharacterized protein n=1 Tax=Chara braunii TaxID=69332 RepID=A0A388LW92_CHABU|nr:hypothetical protein CBR_g41664 [Chara braunii]|eukprot:GBG86600.1 hypothetical protein CBR_g41664 [Chara braunii]
MERYTFRRSSGTTISRDSRRESIITVDDRGGTTAYIGRAIKEGGLHVCGSLIFAAAAGLLLLRSYLRLGQLQARSQVLLQSWKQQLWQLWKLSRKKTRHDRVMGSAAKQILSDNIDVNDMQQKPYSTVPPAWLVHALAMVAFLLLFFTPVYKAADSVRQRPLRELAISARAIQREGEPLIMVGTRMPSVVFYSRRPVAFFDKLEEAESVVQHEAAPGIRSAVAIVEKSLWTPGTRTMAYDELQQKGDYILLRMLRAIGNSVSHNWAKVGRGETTSIGSAEGSREASYWGQMLKLWKDIFPSRVKEPRTREEVLCQPLFCSARIRDIQGKPLTLTARATKWGTWVEHGVLQINHLMGGREEAVEDSQGTRSGTERKPQTVEKPQRSSGIDPAGMDRTATKETSVGARRSGHMAAGGTTMGNVQNLEPGARKDECG